MLLPSMSIKPAVQIQGGGMKKLTTLLKINVKLLLVLLVSLLFINCGSSITGEVTEMYSNEPIQDATVMASTSTNIAEDKKYERKSAKTDASGKFTIKGVSPKYNYRIEALKDGYFTTEAGIARIQPPEGGKTRIINRPLALIKKQMVTGNIVERFSLTGIPGAKVVATAKKRKRIIDKIITSTDDNGTFEIGPFQPKHNYKIDIIKEGYCWSGYSFRNPGNVTRFNNDLMMLKFPHKGGIYFKKPGESNNLEKMEQFKAKFHKVKIDERIGFGGATVYTKHYVSKKDMVSEHTCPRGQNAFLVVVLYKESSRESYIVPFAFYKRLPSAVGGGSKTTYFRERNVYLYAGLEPAKNPFTWNQFQINNMKPEVYKPTAGKALVYLIPLKNLQKGHYVFTIKHAPKWIFTIT